MEIEVAWEPDEETVDALKNLEIDLDAFKYEASRLARLKIDAKTFENELLRAAYRLIPYKKDLEEDFIYQITSSISQHLRYAFYDIREKHNIPLFPESEVSENITPKRPVQEVIQEASRKPSTPVLMEETDARQPAEIWMQEPIPQPEDITKPAPPTAWSISLSKLMAGPQCLSEFRQEWHKLKWAILFDLPRSAIPTELIIQLLYSWKVINVEKINEREKILTHSTLVLTRTHYPSRYESPIRPSPKHPYVKRLLAYIRCAHIVITTREIYNMNGVKEMMDNLKFMAVEVTTLEEERIALKKLEELNLDSHYWRITPRLQKTAVLIPWLIEVYSRDGLEGVREHLYKVLTNKKDAEMLFETIKAVLKNEELKYPCIPMSLGILGEGSNKSK